MIKNDTERSFYEQQCINERWSVRELKRQKKTGKTITLPLVSSWPPTATKV
jgi:predicted nuclease of restriction endonuclease-like (RecB) superfamily